MAAVPLFRCNNMAAVISRENTLLEVLFVASSIVSFSNKVFSVT